MPPPPSRRSAAGHLLLLVLVSSLLYAPAATFGYVAADDTDLVVANQPFLRDFGNLTRAFTRSYFEVAGQPSTEKTYYRPFVVMSLMLDAKVSGARPAMYHVSNIVLHVLTVLLLHRLLLILGTAPGAALLLAVLFAVHPLNVQTVCWILGRNDSLLAIGGLSSLVGLARDAARPSRAAVGLHVVGFAIALFSKETAVMLAPLFVLYAWLWRGDRGYYRRRYGLLAIYAIVLAGWFVLRQRALAGGRGPDAFPEMATLWATLPNLFIYLGKVFMPYRLSTVPGVTATALTLGLVSAALLIWLLLTWWPYDKALFVASWFVLLLAPALAVPGVPAYENRAYFPLAGLMVGFAPLGEAVASRLRQPRVAAIVAGALVILAARSAVHEAAFRDAFAFWGNGTDGTPFAPMAHVNIGELFEQQGDLARASSHYVQALALDPAAAGANNNLGVIQAKQENHAGAREYFEKELASHPSNRDARYNLGLTYKLEGRVEEAIPHWEQTIALDPYYRDAYEQLAEYYEAKGDSARAQSYRAALKTFTEPPR